MRVAVACDGLNVSMQNGRCESFMCYTIERGIITQCQNTPNPCLSPKLSANFLKQLGVDVLLVNILDPAFAGPYKHAGIEVATGLTGPAQQAVETYLNSLFDGDDQSFDDEAYFDTSSDEDSSLTATGF